MFNYSNKTEINMQFKINELLKTIKADKVVKADTANITAVKLTNTLSPTTTGLDESDSIREIYVVDIELSSSHIPDNFIEAFNNFIEFQTLFRLHYKDEVKYIISIKQFFEDKMKVLKTFESTWQKHEKLDMPPTLKLENLFKDMVKYVSGYSFKKDENFVDYVQRLEQIRKLKNEIEKQTKTMNNEKQPNIKMAMNDKIKQMKKQLQELEV